MWREALPLVTLVLASCSSSTGLVVDLRTDLAPGVEFHAVAVDLAPMDDAPPEPPAVRFVSPDDDYLRGVRVAEVRGLRAGTWSLTVRLLDASDAEVAVRRVRVSLRSAQSVTVVVGRDCFGLRCPEPGDDPGATSCSCRGRACVPPGAVVDEVEDCGPEQCATDADCPPRAECATPRCLDGACLFEARHAACGDDGYCDVERGCLPLVDVGPDAGPARDGGADGAVGCEAGFADCNRDASDGCETRLGTATSCSACDDRCEGATPVCEGSAGSFACAGEPCAPGFERCGSECVDVGSDPSHCGACDAGCGTGEDCVGGTCACGGAPCAPGEECCDGACAVLSTDDSHCGFCGRACDPGETCSGGACLCGGDRCSAFAMCCDGACVDGLSDPDHCGSCGNRCGPEETCGSGLCGCGSGVALCSGSRSCCSDLCVDTDSDPEHCGGCGVRCDAPAVCVGGVCT